MGSQRAKSLGALGVAANADDATIKKAFKKLALKHHPDRNPNAVEEATEKFKVVNEAYTYLNSTVGRAAASRPPPEPRRPGRAPPPSARAADSAYARQQRAAAAERARRRSESDRRDREREERRRRSADDEDRERRRARSGEAARAEAEAEKRRERSAAAAAAARTEDEADLERAKRVREAARERERLAEREKAKREEKAAGAKARERERTERAEERTAAARAEAEERERGRAAEASRQAAEASRRAEGDERERRARLTRLAAEARAREFARARAAEEAVRRKRAEDEAKERAAEAAERRKWDDAVGASSNAAAAELRARSQAARAQRDRWAVDDGGGGGGGGGMTEDDAAWWRANRDRASASSPRDRDRDAEARDAEATATAARRTTLDDAERLYQRAQDTLRKGREAREARAADARSKAAKDWSARDQDAFYEKCCDAAAAVLGGGGGAPGAPPTPAAGEELDRLLRAFGRREGGGAPAKDFGETGRPILRPPEMPERRTYVAGADGSIRRSGAPPAAKKALDPKPFIAPPAALRVANAAATSVELEWDGTGESRWQLQWSKDGGLSFESAPRLLEASRCRKRNLPPDTGIVFRVRTVSERAAGQAFSAWAVIDGRTSPRAPADGASAFQAAVEDAIPSARPPAEANAAGMGLSDAFAAASKWAAESARRPRRPSVDDAAAGDDDAWESASHPPRAEKPARERWHELEQTGTGDHFFWNESTGETRWERDEAWAVGVDEATGAPFYVAPTPPRPKRSKRPSLDGFLPNAAAGRLRRSLQSVFAKPGTSAAASG